VDAPERVLVRVGIDAAVPPRVPGHHGLTGVQCVVPDAELDAMPAAVDLSVFENREDLALADAALGLRGSDGRDVLCTRLAGHGTGPFVSTRLGRLRGVVVAPGLGFG
jgi:hypothetical protein